MLKTLCKDQGRLDRVGFTFSIQDKEHEGLAKKLRTDDQAPGFTGKAPGREPRTVPCGGLAPKSVAGVPFDHCTDGGFRPGTKFSRWRTEKERRDSTSRG